MESTFIAWKHKDGSVWITEIKNKDIEKLDKIKKDIKKQHPDFLESKEVPFDKIPTDKTFRAAWNYDLQVDMDKAKTIHMERLRSERDRMLEKLDQRRYGSEHDNLRQKLRDMPQDIDLTSISSPDELKAFRPDVLDALS